MAYNRVLDPGRYVDPAFAPSTDPFLTVGQLELSNASGAQIQHRFFQFEGNPIVQSASPKTPVETYLSKISAASMTLTNTPALAAGVGFAAGGGVLAASNFIFIFDTAAQLDDEPSGVAFVHVNSTGTGNLLVRPFHSNVNINGVTQKRASLIFSLGNGTGNAFPLTVANIPIGTVLRVGFILGIR